MSIILYPLLKTIISQPIVTPLSFFSRTRSQILQKYLEPLGLVINLIKGNHLAHIGA